MFEWDLKTPLKPSEALSERNLIFVILKKNS